MNAKELVLDFYKNDLILNKAKLKNFASRCNHRME